MRGATFPNGSTIEEVRVSIHAPHAGRDFIVYSVYVDWMFQSTRPMRGATLGRVPFLLDTDVSIHAPHAGRDIHDSLIFLPIIVSIHAPHAGRDLCCG